MMQLKHMLAGLGLMFAPHRGHRIIPTVLDSCSWTSLMLPCLNFWETSKIGLWKLRFAGKKIGQKTSGASASWRPKTGKGNAHHIRIMAIELSCFWTYKNHKDPSCCGEFSFGDGRGQWSPANKSSVVCKLEVIWRQQIIVHLIVYWRWFGGTLYRFVFGLYGYGYMVIPG